jgi:phytoene desaturase
LKYRKGSGAVLHDFMMEAQSNYNIAIKDLVYRPGVSPLVTETAKKSR